MAFIYSQFSLPDGLKEGVRFFVERIFKVAPVHLSTLDKDNISMTFPDEMTIEWISGNQYVRVRLKDGDYRCEAKFSGGERFTKWHVLVAKIMIGVIQSLDRMQG